MKNILQVNNLSKSFRSYSSEYKRILSWFGIKLEPKKTHHILKNISFSILEGEAVGIVGQNGAGKSTLLKIIAGTLKPSEGSFHTDGRVSAILELGMGFNPNLTGRQNVYHAAGLMGFTSLEVDNIVEDLQKFAEIGDYFDQPVRTYSSGMQLRIAFGIVTAYRPEILIVDEALSVGDTYFQHKSLARIREFQKQGTTLLLVSHDKGAIQAICDRAILLEKGQIIKDGNPEEVMDFYNVLIANKENKNVQKSLQENHTLSGTGEVTLAKYSLLNQKSEPVQYINVGEQITLNVSANVNKDIEQLVLGFMIKDRLGQTIFGTNTHHLNQILYTLKKGSTVEFSFTFPVTLGVGSYTVAIAVHGEDTHISANYEWRNQALLFQVSNPSKSEFIGMNWLPTTAKVTHVR